jgi:hypothetical protein
MIITGKYAASNLVLRQGIEVDLSHKKFRKTRKILGLFNITEEWRPLPASNYILLFQTFYANCEACDLNDKDESGTLQVSLVYRKSRKLIIHEGKNKAEIISIASKLSEHLSLKIKDAMTNRRAPKFFRPGHPG